MAGVKRQPASEVSLSSAGSSGGPAPLPSSDDPLPIAAPALVVANICTSLAEMTGAIMCWYFSAHTQVWGTGFFEGTFNIGASLAVLGVLLCQKTPNFVKISFALTLFFLGLVANFVVLCRTVYNLYFDIDHVGDSIKSHAMTIFGATASSACLIFLAIRGVKGALKVQTESNLEFGSHSLCASPKEAAKIRQYSSATLAAPRERQRRNRDVNRRCQSASVLNDDHNKHQTSPRGRLTLMVPEDGQFTPRTHSPGVDSVELAYLANQQAEMGGSDSAVMLKLDHLRPNDKTFTSSPSGSSYTKSKSPIINQTNSSVFDDNITSDDYGDPTVVSAGTTVVDDWNREREQANSMRRYLQRQQGVNSTNAQRQYLASKPLLKPP